MAAAATAIAKTPVRNNSQETVVVIVLTKVREDIEAARPLLVRILKPGKWFSFKRTDDLQGEEEQWHGYICLDSLAFNLNAWVTFDTAAVWAARSAEIRGADEMGPLQLLPHPTDRLHKTLNEKANMKNPFKMVTSIISQIIQDVTLVILDRAREEGEACVLLFVRNVTGGSTSEVNVKSVFGDELERVDEVYAYLMFPDQLFKQEGYVWVNFPARMLTDGDFIISPSRPAPTTFAFRSEKRSRVAKSRGLTWARANFSG